MQHNNEYFQKKGMNVTSAKFIPLKLANVLLQREID